MTRLSNLKVKIFADGADRAGMLDLYRNPLIKGFTTNPTLMHNAGITNYEAFAATSSRRSPTGRSHWRSFRMILPRWRRRPAGSRRGESNVYVKIPVTNTHGESSIPLIRRWPKRASSKTSPRS